MKKFFELCNDNRFKAVITQFMSYARDENFNRYGHCAADDYYYEAIGVLYGLCIVNFITFDDYEKYRYVLYNYLHRYRRRFLNIK